MPRTATRTEAAPDVASPWPSSPAARASRPPPGASAAANGAMNRLRPEDAAAHHWYRFVLSFPPHLVRTYLDRFRVGPSHRLLDPFCGTGTTLVEAKKTGIPSEGVEALPLPHLAATVKTDWSAAAASLERHAAGIAERASEALDRDRVPDFALGGGSRAGTARSNGKPALRTLPEEAARLLLADSISPLPLHKVLTLTAAMERAEHPQYSGYERVALAAALVSDIGNVRFGPEVGVGKIRSDAAVIAPWRSRVARMAKDLRELADRQDVESRVHLGDAREVASFVAPNSIDAVITSPPYPNEKDYTRTVRLESVLLGFLGERRELRASKQTLLRSNTRGVYRADADDRWVRDNGKVQEIAARIESRRLAAGKNSGFERQYHRVAKLYFGGMSRHFTSLSRCLKPGARLAYVVGDQASYLRVMIRTGELLAEIAEKAGYEVEAIDLFRTRPATATREQLREEVVVLRWPG